MEKITEDKNVIEAIIREAQVCRIGLCDDGQPYIVPVSFGYEDDTLYFHCSKKGRKIDVLRKNNAVCFELDVDREIVRSGDACNWSVKYRSVIGFGKAFFAQGLAEKTKALDLIVTHYGGRPTEYSEAMLRKTTIVRVEIQSMTAKVSSVLLNLA